MRDRTRRYEAGKMLMDLAKYFATGVGISGLTSQRINWIMVMTGCVMALINWMIGFWTIPDDKEEE